MNRDCDHQKNLYFVLRMRISQCQHHVQRKGKVLTGSLQPLFTLFGRNVEVLPLFF